MKKIRLGMVRADTHGYYYGIMLDKCDPLVLQKNDYVVHHYASSIYDAESLSAPRVPGFEITRIYDEDFARAQRFSETFGGRPVPCRKLEDVADGVDAVAIMDCDGGGGDHLKFATPSLKRGIPTFVDKPFASTLKDARAIVRLARKSGAPLFNASILTYVPAADHFKSRFDEIRKAYWPLPAGVSEAPLLQGVVKGVGGAFSQDLSGKAITGGIEDRLAYIIHGVSLALNLFGTGVEWVEAMGALPLEYLHLHLHNGNDVVILNTSTDVFPETCSFYASAYSRFGAVNSPPIGDPEFLGGGQKIMQMFRKMVRSGVAPVDYEDFLEHIAVVEAAQIAQDKGSRVELNTVWRRRG
jgi:hypothetical protein